MRTQIKQTQIICDCCSVLLNNPLSELHPPAQVINYLGWGDLDICTNCCMKILRSLLTEKKVSEDDLKRYGRHI